MELEMAQNQAHFVASKNKKLEEQVSDLKAQLYAKDVELQRKQEELNTAKLQCSQIGYQWQSYSDQAVNETASRWRSHSEALEAEKQNEIEASSSVREEVEKLREEYDRFKAEKERTLSESLDEVERLTELVTQQDAINEKRGFMDQMIFEILRGTKCMDVQYSLKQDEIRVGNLTKLVKEAMDNDYFPAAQLMEVVKRHKSWEASERKQLCEDIRGLVVEKEVDFAYKRHESIRSMESLRDRTLQHCRELAAKMRSDTTNAEVHKKRYHELVEEHFFVEKKVLGAEERLNAERERLSELTVSGHAMLVHEAQANIQENLLDVQKWVGVKKDIYYTMKVQEDVYFKAMETRDTSREKYELRQRIHDEGIGQAYVSAIKIVSDADEIAAAEDYKKQIQKEKQAEAREMERKVKERKERRKKEVEATETKRRDEESKRGKPSPASLVGTHATWSRIRERMQGKYDFNFSEFISKDSKFNRGDVAFKKTKETEALGLHEPPLSRALFAENARKSQEASRKEVMDRVETRAK
jgi:hypothetical protein